MTLRPRFDPYRAAMVPSVIPLAKAAEPAEMPPVVYTLLGVPYTVVPDRRYGFLFKAARRKPAPGQMSFFDAPKAPKAPGTGGRKKMQEGATRMKNGQQQVLKNSRWRNVEPKGKAIPKPGLSIIPDGTPSKVKPKTRKGKEWQSSSPAKAPAAVGGEAMGATSLRPKAKPPLPMPSVLGDEDIFEDNAPATSSTLKPKGESKKSTSPQYKLGPSETTPYLVDVSGITSTVPRSAFDADQVESLAQSILESGGLLSPIVLKQTGPESFEVLAGDLEYHAAARAKELDPRKGEMVNAYVVPPQNQAAAVEQVNRAKPTVRPKKGDSTSPQYKLGPSETKHYLVDVSGITSTVPRSAFGADQVESLAQSILESGGLLSPIVLKQTGPESYEVLAGDLEYHAAARAKELDPRKGEMVNAYVVPPQHQAAAVAQVTPATPVEAEVVADDEPSLGDMPEKSDGHIGFDHETGHEYIQTRNGDVSRASISDPIMPDGRRFARFESTAAGWASHPVKKKLDGETEPTLGDMLSEQKAGAGDVDRAGMGYKIRSAGAEFELLKEHSDGSYTVRNDQGMVWRDTFDPSVTSVVPPANKKTGKSSLDAIRAMPESDYVKMTVGGKQSDASNRLQSAENAIRKYLQDKKIRLPVGIHPGQWIESKTKLTKDEKRLRTEYLLAKKNHAHFHDPKNMDYERREAMAAHRVMTGKIQPSEASIVIHDDPNYGLSLKDKLTAPPVEAEVVADDEPTTLRPKIRSRAERQKDFDDLKGTMQDAARSAIRAAAEVADFYEGTVAAVADGLGVGEDVGEVGGNRAKTEAMLAERDPLQAEPTTLRPKRTRAERKQDFDQIKQNLYDAGVSTVRAAQSVQQMGDTAAGAVADAYGLDLDDNAGLGGTNTPQLEPTLGDMLSEQKAIAGNGGATIATKEPVSDMHASIFADRSTRRRVKEIISAGTKIPSLVARVVNLPVETVQEHIDALVQDGVLTEKSAPGSEKWYDYIPMHQRGNIAGSGR